jgi:hypothetical protein
MAKFLKIITTSGTNPEVLIGIDQITHAAMGEPNGDDPSEVVTIFYTGGTCTISLNETGLVPAAALLKAVNAALAANPGGIVSTVNMPLTTPQTVVPATSGRQLITAPAVYQTVSVAFA